MPEQDLKKLLDLRVVDLKLELERRGLNKNGVKMALTQRLRKSLKDNDGVDPDYNCFDVANRKKSNSYNRRKSSDESHYLELLDSNQAESKSSSKHQYNTLSKENSKVVSKEVFTELSNENFMKVTEEVSETSCQTVPSKLTTNRNLKYMSKEKEPEKVKFIQQNTISKSSIEDLAEEECIDLVVVEEDEDQLHLSFDDEMLHDRETSTPVSLSSSDDNIVDAGNGKNKPRDLDNRRKRTWVKKAQDTPSNRKIATTTQKKTADETCSKVVWVSNVSHNTSASELQDALSAHGNVIGAKVVVSARYPGSSCYGYVTMASNKDVDNVIAKLNNTELNGQIIKLGRKLNDNITTRTRSKDASKIQEKETVTERGLQQNISIERSSSMGKSRPHEGSYYSNERFKHRQSRSPCRKSGILTFAQIKEERERQKMREQERALREASRRRQEEIAKQKDIDRRQRQEAMRLKREKEKLRIEKEKIVREREELVKLERERYKIAQEKIELEKTLSRLEEGRIKRPAPHWVNGRKVFATGNRHFEAAASPSKNNSASTWSLYGSSKNNCGKIRPYDGGNCHNKKSRNYDGPSRPSSSKYDSKPNDCQDRTLPHRPKQNSGNVKELNVYNMYKEFKRNNDLHYNKTKSRLFGSSKPLQTSVIPNWPATFDKSDWRPTPVQNDRWVSGNPHQLHPYSNMPSNLNPQYAPQARTTSYYNEKRVGNAKSVGSSNSKF